MKGDGDVVWSRVLDDCSRGTLSLVYDAGRIEAGEFLAARCELVPSKTLHVGVGPNRAQVSEAVLIFAPCGELMGQPLANVPRTL